MRLSAQNNQFIFNFPEEFIDSKLEKKFQILMEKNFIPYSSIIEYINSTIKEIVFPSTQFESSTQTKKRGKEVTWKPAKSVFDTVTRELDITMRSVDSHLNYFAMFEILQNFYLNNDKNYIDFFHLDILDKDGDVIYTVNFEDVLLRSLSEVRLSYNTMDFSEKLFSVTFNYNYINILWKIDDKEPIDEKNLFDVDIKDVDHRL